MRPVGVSNMKPIGNLPPAGLRPGLRTALPRYTPGSDSIALLVISSVAGALTKLCHGRAWPGHPRLSHAWTIQDVGGRAKPGHDTGRVGFNDAWYYTPGSD